MTHRGKYSEKKSKAELEQEAIERERVRREKRAEEQQAARSERATSRSSRRERLNTSTSTNQATGEATSGAAAPSGGQADSKGSVKPSLNDPKRWPTSKPSGTDSTREPPSASSRIVSAPPSSSAPVGDASKETLEPTVKLPPARETVTAPSTPKNSSSGSETARQRSACKLGRVVTPAISEAIAPIDSPSRHKPPSSAHRRPWSRPQDERSPRSTPLPISPGTPSPPDAKRLNQTSLQPLGSTTGEGPANPSRSATPSVSGGDASSVPSNGAWSQRSEGEVEDELPSPFQSRVPSAASRAASRFRVEMSSISSMLVQKKGLQYVPPSFGVTFNCYLMTLEKAVVLFHGGLWLPNSRMMDPLEFLSPDLSVFECVPREKLDKVRAIVYRLELSHQDGWWADFRQGVQKLVEIQPEASVLKPYVYAGTGKRLYRLDESQLGRAAHLILAVNQLAEALLDVMEMEWRHVFFVDPGYKLVHVLEGHQSSSQVLTAFAALRHGLTLDREASARTRPFFFSKQKCEADFASAGSTLSDIRSAFGNDTPNMELAKLAMRPDYQDLFQRVDSQNAQNLVRYWLDKNPSEFPLRITTGAMSCRRTWRPRRLHNWSRCNTNTRKRALLSPEMASGSNVKEEMVLLSSGGRIRASSRRRRLSSQHQKGKRRLH
ncbi:hypothetical protein GGF50DRAFT_120940 [Schizophyllum commune]